MEIHGKVRDLNAEADQRLKSRQRARKEFEPTLPWTLTLLIRNSTGHVVGEWHPEFVVRTWDSTVNLTFCPETDMFLEE